MRSRVPASLLVLLLAAACHHAAPVATPAPSTGPDLASQRRADSLSAAERAREDSIARANAEAARLAAEAERLRGLSLALRDTLLQMIHFDYDKADIRPGDQQILARKLALLQANPALMIRIAGHCDERGSEEYNLALGNRRAIVAREYLVTHGVSGDRIATVSYGKERPLMTGHDDASWAANRRDEFEPTRGAEQLSPPLASR